MAVKIGHASSDENRKITGGTSGDQTKKEVYIRDWYKKDWDVVLRPKSKSLAEKSAKACEAGCANNKIGYDQNGRNSLYKRAKEVNFDLSKITVACECDCSSFMHTCAIAGGANLDYGSNGFTTRTMVDGFMKSGNYTKLTASKYLTSDKYLKRGDVVVNEGHHTFMVLSNGSKVSNSVVVNDNPIITVKEWQLAAIADGFKFPKAGADGKWGSECESVVKETVCKKRTTYKYKNLTKLVQEVVGVEVDGYFGADTKAAVKAYQKNNGLTADGSVGPKTWKHILGVG